MHLQVKSWLRSLGILQHFTTETAVALLFPAVSDKPGERQRNEDRPLQNAESQRDADCEPLLRAQAQLPHDGGWIQGEVKIGDCRKGYCRRRATVSLHVAFSPATVMDKGARGI